MAVIILGVFKWIGIILLCILGLMLLLWLAVLLIPIRYQLYAVWQESEGKCKLAAASDPSVF